ncbi:MAG: hypothetical protein Ct9H90mP13_09590 [Pseudomonadota bacterium]|nr:MAG: hypothetical protein Ct9H90mP13_09590 [Pseudomonadota bacterium]
MNYVGIWDLEMFFDKGGRFGVQNLAWFRNPVVDVEKMKGQLKNPPSIILKNSGAIIHCSWKKGLQCWVEQG